MENPIKNGWFGGTTIFGNIHVTYIDDTATLYYSVSKTHMILICK